MEEGEEVRRRGRNKWVEEKEEKVVVVVVVVVVCVCGVGGVGGGVDKDEHCLEHPYYHLQFIVIQHTLTVKNTCLPHKQIIRIEKEE